MFPRFLRHPAAHTPATPGAAAVAVGSVRPALGLACLGWALGTALQLQQAALWVVQIYGVFSLFGLAGIAWVAIKMNATNRWRGLAAAMAALALGFGTVGLRALAFEQQALNPALEGQDLLVSGHVAAMPQRGSLGLRFRFVVAHARDASGQTVALPPRLLLGWYGEGQSAAGVPDVQAGQRWLLPVRLRAPHGNRNPGGFDYELWLWEQGFQATGSVRSGRSPVAGRAELLGQDVLAHPVEWLRQQARDAVLARVADRRLAGVVAALLVGDQAAIERADWDIFRATGVAHLMSISGLHVTLFAWLAALLVAALWRRSTRLCLRLPVPHAAALGGVLLALAYALFSGWGVPAQRTVGMLAVVAALRLSGRHWPWPRVWLVTLAAVLLWDPWALLAPGFWLSFVAVGILFASNSIANNAHTTSRNGLFSAAKRLLREQAVVTLALTPLSLLWFGQISLVGFAANLLAIPWVTLLVTPLCLAGVLWGGFWDGAAWAVDAMGHVLALLAALPVASITRAQAPLWAGLAAVAGGVLLVLRLPLPARALGLPMLLPALLWQPQRPASGQFDLLAADVSQGTAVRVRTAQHTLLYDAGPRWGPDSDAGHRVLLPLLRRDNERLDLLLLSHRDTDHTGGAAAVLAQQPQAALLGSVHDGPEWAQLLARPAQAPIAPPPAATATSEPATTASTTPGPRPAQAVAAPGFPLLPGPQRCTAGQQWDWDGVHFAVLHPDARDYSASPAPKSNALSCVLKITSASGQSALLTGDIEAAQEAALLARSGAELAANVLLVPHHGSRTSSTEAFIDAVAPRTAWVQAGYRNRFGHPTEAVMNRFRARDVELRLTPQCGAIIWASDAPERSFCERDHAPRYWQHRLR